MKTIAPKQLKELLDKDKAVLFDTRTPDEHKSQRIEKSLQISPSEIAKNIQSGDKIHVIHCEMGACTIGIYQDIMRENPLLDIYILEGGLQAWREAGLPVSGTGRLSILRQFHLIVGIFSLSGIILGTFVNLWFYLIPAFFSCGLIFSGATGICGLHQVLRKMPWNQ